MGTEERQEDVVMKSDIPAIVILVALAIFTYFLCGQRDMQIQSVNDRLALLEKQARHGNIPRITVERGSVYAGSGEIIVTEVKK